MKTRSIVNIALVCFIAAALSLSACASSATSAPPPPVAVQSRPVAAPTQPPAPPEVGPYTGGNTPPNGQAFDAMFFKQYGVNPIIDTEDDHLSTFAMDVDTASYTIARRYINEGHLPPPESVRVEEFINYFNYDYPSPASGAFAIHLEGSPSPFGGEKYYLLRIGLQGRRIPSEQRKDAVLTFVIDVSGSMGSGNRLGMVKQALNMLVEELRPTDKVGIVVYGTRAHVVLEPTPASSASSILHAIESLQTEGSTNAEEGLRMGYQMAAQAFDSEALNRVILCSDGVANVGQTGADAILREIKEHAGRDITLSTVGFGMGNYNDVLMEQLADKGNGNYSYVDTLDQARRVFVENLTGMLQVIAQDAKVQVDFNSAVVSRFRLIGYENRAIENKDFRNDTVDAGEVGAGHNVTALYEVKFKDEAVSSQQGNALIVYVRYQDPETGRVREINRAFARSQFASSFEATSPRFQLAAAVAEYAEILRQSYWAKGGSLETVQGLAQRVKPALPGDQDVAELVQLVGRASQLAAR